MARDRLAAMRAQQGGGGGAQGYGGYGGGNNGYGDHSYPSQQSGQQYGQQGAPQYGGAAAGGGYGDGYGAQPQAPAQGGYGGAAYDPAPGYGNGGAAAYEMNEVPKGNDMNSFFSEISEIQETIRTLDDHINRISDLHSRSLNNMDEASAAQANTQLAGISSDTSRLTNGLKSKIKILEQQNARLPPGGDTNVRRTQVGAVKNRFMESIQRYQQVEQTYRQKYRQRAERQFRIVKPDATPQEVKAALDDDQGGQIFSQALLNSNRHGEARGALREVQERHEDIKKIERTITELAQLFNEMSILVEQQDDSLNVIETHAVNVETDMQAGLDHTHKAVDSARKARKKRWICFGIILAILIIVAVVVGVVVSQNVNKNNNNNGNSNSSSPSASRRAILPYEQEYQMIAQRALPTLALARALGAP